VAQFRYRLQTLYDRRVQAKEEAQHALAAAQQELRTEQEELEACRREQDAGARRLKRARAEIVSPAVRGSSGTLMCVRRDYIPRLQDEWRSASDATAAQELIVSEAEDRLTAAREMLAIASRAVEALEKHRARLERRFNEEAERKDALEQEEMANVMFVRRRDAT
jgi:flagellar biosynthesis chaperone FliJ